MFEVRLWYHKGMDINVTSPKAVKALMEGCGIAPLKKYGQNFLIDGNIADKIVQAACAGGRVRAGDRAGIGRADTATAAARMRCGGVGD